jgi:hypothetical protein
LFYGIVPIVLSSNIGDYESYGYEFLKIENFNVHTKRPESFSQKNNNIIKMLIYNNKQINIKSELLRCKIT